MLVAVVVLIAMIALIAMCKIGQTSPRWWWQLPALHVKSLSQSIVDWFHNCLQHFHLMQQQSCGKYHNAGKHEARGFNAGVGWRNLVGTFEKVNICTTWLFYIPVFLFRWIRNCNMCSEFPRDLHYLRFYLYFADISKWPLKRTRSMLFYFVMVGSQIKDDINSARYGEGSRASLTVIFFPEVRNRKETESGHGEGSCK